MYHTTLLWNHTKPKCTQFFIYMRKLPNPVPTKQNSSKTPYYHPMDANCLKIVDNKFVKSSQPPEGWAKVGGTGKSPFVRIAVKSLPWFMDLEERAALLMDVWYCRNSIIIASAQTPNFDDGWRKLFPLFPTGFFAGALPALGLCILFFGKLFDFFNFGDWGRWCLSRLLLWVFVVLLCEILKKKSR